MPAIDPRLIAVFLWVVGCSLATFSLLVWRPSSLPRHGYALVVAFLIRLVPALVLPRGARYEMEVFRQVAQVTLAGQSVYLTKIPHPHLPFQLYWFAVAYWLTGRIGLSFTFWLKVPNILAETAMTGLIYRAIRQKRADKDAVFGSWIYALNPVTILVSAYQGQFDAIPLLLMVTAWYLFEFHVNRPGSQMLSSFVLGLGILSKSWPVILLPIVLLRLPRWYPRVKYTAVAMLVPVAGTLIYEVLFPGSLLSILRRSMHAGAIPGWWGYSAILNVMVELTGHGSTLYILAAKTGKIAALLSGLLAILLMRHRSVLYSLMLTILTLFAFVPNLGLQGLSWLVPLAVMWGALNELGWYIAGATIHMVISYWGIHLTDGLYLLMPVKSANIIIQLSSLTAWGSVILWWAQELLHKQLLPRVFEHRLAK